MISKKEVLSIIDEVMNNREIDSIRNAILAIRDKVKDTQESPIVIDDAQVVKIKLRAKHNGLCDIGMYSDGAEYVCIDSCYKIDSGVYGAIWYE